MSGAASVLYIASALLFIVGLKMLGRTQSARRGNAVSAVGMLLAVVAVIVELARSSTFFTAGNMTAIAIGLAVGALLGVPMALKVRMTSMPEMVALFNGLGGLASLLVGWSDVQYRLVEHHDRLATGVPHAVFAADWLAMLIGGVTLTGSLMAFGKLSERIPGRPVMFAGQQVVNGALVLAAIAGGVAFAWTGDLYWVFLAGIAVSFVLGVLAVLPIGGSDMPVVISLLNSYSGMAACAAGFAVHNNLLIVVGALVGTSGIILTKLMCKAMNRSLANVLFSGFGSATASIGAAAQGTVRSMTPEDAYHVLEAARSVVVVPGYGMAVAQAQHAVRELGELLHANGAEVRYAIHPVAGRMPGHMNVLLAEANVPYEQLVEMADINPQMETVDVALVIGANDTVNPAAEDDPTSPIRGMPIIRAYKARTVFVLKRSMRAGFAGVENPLFFKDNCWLIFGDAKATIEALLTQFKQA